MKVDFMARFNHEKLTLDDLDEHVVLPTLLGGIWPHSPFMVKLACKMPVSIFDFTTKAEEFINTKETIKTFAKQANCT